MHSTIINILIQQASAVAGFPFAKLSQLRDLCVKALLLLLPGFWLETIEFSKRSIRDEQASYLQQDLYACPRPRTMNHAIRRRLTFAFCFSLIFLAASITAVAQYYPRYRSDAPYFSPYAMFSAGHY